MFNTMINELSSSLNSMRCLPEQTKQCIDFGVFISVIGMFWLGLQCKYWDLIPPK